MKKITLILVIVVIAAMSSCTQNKKSSETSNSQTTQEAIPELMSNIISFTSMDMKQSIVLIREGVLKKLKIYGYRLRKGRLN